MSAGAVCGSVLENNDIRSIGMMMARPNNFKITFVSKTLILTF